MLKGFDVSAFPGVPAMKALRGYFDFVGIYLAPAASHPDMSWMQRIGDLRVLGYKFWPVYVGQQIAGPGSKNDTLPQGTKDGNDAADLMAHAGFKPNDPCYLDLENGAPFPPAESTYAFSWIAQVRARGYRPGVYCSHVLAPNFDSETTLVWAFEVPTTRTVLAKLPLSTADAPPATIPWTGMQYRQNIRLDNVKITVDLDATPDALGLAS